MVDDAGVAADNVDDVADVAVDAFGSLTDDDFGLTATSSIGFKEQNLLFKM